MRALLTHNALRTTVALTCSSEARGQPAQPPLPLYSGWHSGTGWVLATYAHQSGQEAGPFTT
eukprot:16331674-Heterocapsa_arctica.AAC.1